MTTDHTLITCIVKYGHADEIMNVARQAGAKGGTILDARGTGTEDDVKFFGISLVPKKEMILIVVRNEQVRAIMDAVCGMGIFSEPGIGIIYTSPVDSFCVLCADSNGGQNLGSI